MEAEPNRIKQETHASRRGFLRVAGAGSAGIALAACAPTAAPAGGGSGGQAPAAAAKPAWETEWDELVAAAKKESKLVVHTLPGEGFKKLIAAFSAAMPGIDVEHTTIFARDLAPRILQERRASVFAWDVVMPPGTTGFGSLFPERVFDPIRPVLFRPDVTGDQYWYGGFDFGFQDDEKKYAFGFGWNLEGGFFVNTDLVKDGDIKTAMDVLNSRWKGKIAVADPQSGGASAVPLTVAALKNGDGYVKRFFTEQTPTLFREPRQGAEMLVRGQVAIAVGTTSPIVLDFANQGFKNVKRILPDDFSYLFQETVWVMNRAPHPAAAKLFVNWLLTKQAQEVYAAGTESNSRRKDVAPVNQATFPPAGAETRYLDMLRQNRYTEAERIRAMTRELLK